MLQGEGLSGEKEQLLVYKRLDVSRGVGEAMGWSLQPLYPLVVDGPRVKHAHPSP